MEMALLLLLFGGFWARGVSPQNLPNSSVLTTTLNELYLLDPFTSETQNLNSDITTRPMARDSTDAVSIRSPTPAPPSSPAFETSESSLLEALGVSTGSPVLEPTTNQEVSTEMSSLLPETSEPVDNVAVNSVGHGTVTNGTVLLNSLENSSGTSGPLGSIATTSDEISGPPVAMTTSSQETSETPVTVAMSSNTTRDPLILTATKSMEPYHETHGVPTSTASSSLEASSTAGGSPVSSIKVSTMSTPKLFIDTSSPPRGSNGMLLVPVLVALLVVIILVALLLMWRRRQKHRTGVLTLSRSGKRNGTVDAWAGPARVPDEEAATALTSGPGGPKGSGAPEADGSGQRPTLTTFFSRRKSRQGSLVLEELKCGSNPSLKREEEPLVGSEDEVVDVPLSDGPEDGAAPQRL